MNDDYSLFKCLIMHFWIAEDSMSKPNYLYTCCIHWLPLIAIDIACFFVFCSWDSRRTCSESGASVPTAGSPPRRWGSLVKPWIWWVEEKIPRPQWYTNLCATVKCTHQPANDVFFESLLWGREDCRECPWNCRKLVVASELWMNVGFSEWIR